MTLLIVCSVALIVYGWYLHREHKIAKAAEEARWNALTEDYFNRKTGTDGVALGGVGTTTFSNNTTGSGTNNNNNTTPVRHTHEDGGLFTPTNIMTAALVYEALRDHGGDYHHESHSNTNYDTSNDSSTTSSDNYDSFSGSSATVDSSSDSYSSDLGGSSYDSGSDYSSSSSSDSGSCFDSSSSSSWDSGSSSSGSDW